MKKTGIVICAVLAVLICVFSAYMVTERQVQREFFAMDTYMSIKLRGRGSGRILDALEKEIKELDVKVLSRQDIGSEVCALNASGGGNPGEKLMSYIDTLTGIYESSGGKYDFTLGALSDLWGFGNGPSVPDAEDIKKVLSGTGADKITSDKGELSFPEGVILDFGSAGKGIALDSARELLKASHISEAVVSAGGSILVYGKREFSVGIADPEGKSGYMGVLTLGECCVSTSGSYERYFEEDGKRYHHILDPDTGYPVNNGLISVTVVSGSGIVSDALSTACFVLGPEKGRELAEEYGCETVFVDSDHNVYVSDGLVSSFEITDSSYSVAVNGRETC